MSGIKLQSGNEPLHFQTALKKGPHPLVVVKVDIDSGCIFPGTELLHQPGLAHLTGAADDERLATLLGFPLLKLLHRHSVHEHHLAII